MYCEGFITITFLLNKKTNHLKENLVGVTAIKREIKDEIVCVLSKLEKHSKTNKK